MAKEQWKKIGIISGLVTLGLSILILAAAGGGKAMAMEKDIESNAKLANKSIENVSLQSTRDIQAVSSNQVEDRASILEIGNLVKSLQDKQNEDYKELKQENNDDKVRAEKIASQFGLILTHMSQQTELGKRQDRSIGDINVSIGKIETKVETLITDDE